MTVLILAIITGSGCMRVAVLTERYYCCYYTALGDMSSLVKPATLL